MNAALRQLLVHLDPTQAACHRLTLARELARQHGAALSALYATTPLVAALASTPEGAAAMAATMLEVEDERRSQTRRMFDETMRIPGPPASWGETLEVQPGWGFAQQGLYVDLLVVGQRDPTASAAGAVPVDFPESVVMASGRPALVVPYIGWPAAVGQAVAIAWKPTREAARAVSAALPFLQRAAKVHVLSWGEDEEAGVQGTRLDLAGYLGRHGVQATWHRGGPEPDALGEVLLSRVFDLGADLLVMGCYGHGRAREWILGGTSRTVLAAMTVPVLMAH